METTRLSTKGQVIIPKSLREAKGWRPGMDLAVEEVGDGLVLRPIQGYPRTTMQEVLGCLADDGPTRSLEDTDAAVAEAARDWR